MSSFPSQADRVHLMQMGQLTTEVVGSSAFGESASIAPTCAILLLDRTVARFSGGEGTRLFCRGQRSAPSKLCSGCVPSSGNRCHTAAPAYVVFRVPTERGSTVMRRWPPSRPAGSAVWCSRWSAASRGAAAQGWS